MTKPSSHSSGIHANSSNSSNSAQCCTALIGGLQKYLGEAEAMKYVKQQILYICGYECARTYIKGEFNGIVFIVFNNEHIRDAAVNELRSSKMNMDVAKLWIVADMQFSIRMQRKCFFGLQKLMLKWDYSPFELYVDTNN